MPEYKGIIALDLDGTLLDSNKQLSPRNLTALQRAAQAGWAVVPTTGRFYNGMPEAVRALPFVRYAITINGAAVEDLATGAVLYRAEIPWQQAVSIMEVLDGEDLIYDCYMDGAGWMTEDLKARVDEHASSPHYRKMIRELRQGVPELKDFIRRRGQNVQKVQLFTKHPQLRLDLMEQLPRCFEGLSISSSVSDNVEINQSHANKGEALLALAASLGVEVERTIAFGDGLNDLPMLMQAGVGVAMANACDEAKAIARWIAPSNDEDGVAAGIERFCLN